MNSGRPFSVLYVYSCNSDAAWAENVWVGVLRSVGVIFPEAHGGDGSFYNDIGIRQRERESDGQSNHNNGSLMKIVLSAYGCSAFANGTDSEKPICDRLVKASGDTAVDLAGMMSIQELMELLRMSRLLVSKNQAP